MRGCHFAFNEDRETTILDWVLAKADKYKPVTCTHIQHYYEAKYSHSISRGRVDALISLHQGNLEETKSTSQEDTRLEVPRTFLHETIHCLREYVHEMKPELVLNLDEVGMSE
jgi:predicted LPLAT superfamily acyltransferase